MLSESARTDRELNCDLSVTSPMPYRWATMQHQTCHILQGSARFLVIIFSTCFWCLIFPAFLVKALKGTQGTVSSQRKSSFGRHLIPQWRNVTLSYPGSLIKNLTCYNIFLFHRCSNSVFTSSPAGVQSIVVSVSVCQSVCPLTYL